MARQRAAERVRERIWRAAVRAALQDAASVAGLLITTDTMVGELPKKEARTPCPGAEGS